MKVKSSLPAITMLALLVNSGHSEIHSRKDITSEQRTKNQDFEYQKLISKQSMRYDFVGDGLVYEGIKINECVIKKLRQ